MTALDRAREMVAAAKWAAEGHHTIGTEQARDAEVAAALLAAEARLKKVTRLVQRNQWHSTDDYWHSEPGSRRLTCVECGEWKPHHAPDCALARFLAGKEPDREG